MPLPVSNTLQRLRDNVAANDHILHVRHRRALASVHKRLLDVRD